MSDVSAAAALTADTSAAASTAATTDAAGAAAAASAATSTAAAGGDDKWWSKFGDEATRGYAETKNFPSAEEAVRSYQNLEKLMGSKANAVMIPGDDAKPEELSAFYDKLGRPGAPENYPVPDAFKEDALVKGFAGEAHKLGITSKQFEGVMGFLAAQQQAQTDVDNGKRDAAAAADIEALRKDNPGVKYDALIENGRRAVRSLGLDGDTLGKIEGAIGTRGMLEMFGKIGASGGEAPFIEGSRSGGMPSVEAARVEYASLQKDKNFMAKWISGDADAVARVNKLSAAMAGGAQ